MSLLETLWLASGSLAALSMLLMAGLIAARALASRRARIEAVRRREVERLLLGGPTGNTPPRLLPRLLIEFGADLVNKTPDHAARVRMLARARELGASQLLQRGLHLRSPRKRSTAATLLGEFPDEASVAALTGALADRHPDVRLAAALSLTHMHRAPPAADLVDKLGLGTAETSTLVTALLDNIAVAAPEQIASLIEQPETPPAVRIAAVDSISASGDSRLVGLLAALTREAAPGAPELAHYLEELGEVGDPSVAPVVTRWLDGPTPIVRAAAAQAAGRLRLAEAAPQIAGLLDDGDWWVRFRAGEALVRLGPGGRQLLADVASHGSATASAAAAIALAERGLAR